MVYLKKHFSDYIGVTYVSFITALIDVFFIKCHDILFFQDTH